MAAVVTLLVLQVVVGWLRRRFAVLRRLLDFPPHVVAVDGELRLRATPTGPQLTADEVMSKLRNQGVYTLDGVHLVVMEPDGSLSVVPAGTTVEGLEQSD